MKCAVRPLLPIALFGCANPDPPPAPVAEKVYDRLHLAPANPVAAPTPVADTARRQRPRSSWTTLRNVRSPASAAVPRRRIAQTRHRRLRRFARRPRPQVHGCRRAISFIDLLPATRAAARQSSCLLRVRRVEGCRSDHHRARYRGVRRGQECRRGAQAIGIYGTVALQARQGLGWLPDYLNLEPSQTAGVSPSHGEIHELRAVRHYAG